MNNNVAVAEIVYEKVKLLPEVKQKEALRFVDYLNYLLKQPQIEMIKVQKYTFSDIVGKLTWPGDAVAVQREIRDEW